MNVVRSSRCIPRMVPGEVRRTPRTAAHPPAGYYVACPACGKVQAVLAAALGGEQRFTEEEDAAGAPVLSMDPPRACDRCAARFSIARDVITVHP